MRRFLMKSA